MKNRFRAAVFFLGLSLLGGCSKTQNDNDAIRAAIEKHLTDRGGLNMNAMDMSLKQVTIKGDEAQAQVEFRVKQGGQTMQVDYMLERVNGVWVVGHGKPAGGEISHPPMDKAMGASPGSSTATGGGATPDFPSMDRFKKQEPTSGQGALPPGHPQTSPPVSAPH